LPQGGQGTERRITDGVAESGPAACRQLEGHCQGDGLVVVEEQWRQVGAGSESVAAVARALPVGLRRGPRRDQLRDAKSATDEAEADQVKWGQVQAPAGFHLMAYDVPAARPHEAGVASYFVSVRGADADELTGYCKVLTAEGGGTGIVVPLTSAGWAPLYGLTTDRFGVTWVLDFAVAYDG
jgi:PhnB protein